MSPPRPEWPEPFESQAEWLAWSFGMIGGLYAQIAAYEKRDRDRDEQELENFVFAGGRQGKTAGQVFTEATTKQPSAKQWVGGPADESVEVPLVDSGPKSDHHGHGCSADPSSKVGKIQ